MSQASTSQLIRMLHYQGILRNDQLRDVLVRFKDADVNSMLEALTNDGTVDEDWARQSRDALRTRARKPKDNEELFQIDRAFGGIALRNKWINVSELEEAILEQQRLHRVKLFFRIGEILLHLNYLQVEQVREILLEQGKHVHGCSACSSIVAMAAGVGEKCPICNGDLSDSLFLDLIQADTRFEPQS